MLKKKSQTMKSWNNPKLTQNSFTDKSTKTSIGFFNSGLKGESLMATTTIDLPYIGTFHSLLAPGSYNIPSLIGSTRHYGRMKNSPKYSFGGKYCPKLHISTDHDCVTSPLLQKAHYGTNSPGVGTYSPTHSLVHPLSRSFCYSKDPRKSDFDRMNQYASSV